MRQKKKLKILLSLGLALFLCAGITATALAAGEPIEGTEQDPADVTITKILQMPESTTTPAASFSFTFNKTAFNGDSAEGSIENMPEIAAVIVSFETTDVGTTENGIKTVTEETSGLFADVVWPNAGVYTYTVTEVPDTYTAANGETMSYSGTTYDLEVYVANGDNGLYISAVSAIVVVPDTATQEIEDKVETATFTNTFERNNSSTDPSQGTLIIDKIVEGSFGSYEQYFTFTLTVTKSALTTEDRVYKVYVINEDGTIVTPFENIDADLILDDETGMYFEVTSGVSLDVKLKHGQSLSFVDAAIGTTYTVTEAIEGNYAQSLVVTAGETSTGITGTDGTPISTGTQTVAEGGSRATFTNTYSDVTPLGISLTQLSYLAMILLAAGIFTAYLIAKSRKNRKGAQAQ